MLAFVGSSSFSLLSSLPLLFSHDYYSYSTEHPNFLSNSSSFLTLSPPQTHIDKLPNLSFINFIPPLVFHQINQKINSFLKKVQTHRSMTLIPSNNKHIICTMIAWIPSKNKHITCIKKVLQIMHGMCLLLTDIKVIDVLVWTHFSQN